MKPPEIESPAIENRQLRQRVEKLEREWLEEHRIIEVLIAAGFVTAAKAEEARNIVRHLP